MQRRPDNNLPENSPSPCFPHSSPPKPRVWGKPGVENVNPAATGNFSGERRAAVGQGSHACWPTSPHRLQPQAQSTCQDAWTLTEAQTFLADHPIVQKPGRLDSKQRGVSQESGT